MKTCCLHSNYSENNLKAPQKQPLREIRKPPRLSSTHTVNCIYFTFHLNIFLKFELQYEWTPQETFFCGHRVLQLFCHNIEADHAIKRSQKYLGRKFC